ncbi:TetR/AcrR family transcriptional regulator [Micromonospora sp. NPDC051006]|uniref:TetR/AcrR family transcriptional regulator n=1 Tax=Micromonospora sp. NPDC051006 TaxID=3364283 RepID=UPI0037A69C21
MPTSPNPLRRNEASRRAILDAALQLCAELGYGRLTIEAIAARAGVSKKTIYRWWPSKGAVVLEAVNDVATTVAEHPYSGDLAADLRTQLTAVIALLTPSNTSAVVGLIAEALHDDELAQELRERLIRPRISAFNKRMHQAQLDGQLAADADLDVAVDLVYGPLYHRLVFHLGMPDQEQLHTLVAHALRALGQPAHDIEATAPPTT